MGAMYRFNHDEWNYDRAYEEMKNYDFYTRFGHGALKKYVEDYWQRLQTKGPRASSAHVFDKEAEKMMCVSDDMPVCYSSWRL